MLRLRCGACPIGPGIPEALPEHTFASVGEVETGRERGVAGGVARTMPLDRQHGVAVRELGGRAQPVTLARDQLLPVLPPLADLFPEGGLRRGSTVVVRPGQQGDGATSLAMALMVSASQAGSWCAAVGLADVGPVAAAGLGVCLERLALVPAPGDQWPAVTAALLDAVDVVLVRARRPRPADVRRLAARARERGTVLLAYSGSWPDGADLRLAVAASAWQGLGQGHGHLQARAVEVAATGRGAAARPRRARMWLPGPGGTVAALMEATVEAETVEVAALAPEQSGLSVPMAG
jgi:hypothetical protein